jgi:uncharacterized membrane protein
MSSQIEKSNSILQRLANISLLLYPIVAHIGILMDQVIFPVCYLMAAVYINSLKLFSRYRIFGAVFTFVMCILFYAIINSELHALIIYLPPVLIPCWLAFVFLGSLTTESALISRIAERMEGQALDRRHLLYTRRLTALWGSAFLLMIAEAIVLAIWAPFEVWSWWVHVGNYIIVATLFLIEMSVRHQFIGQRAQFVQMFRALLQRNWHDK